MEIIGVTNGGYIVKIEKSELEQLTGYYYGKSGKAFSIGAKLQVDKLYDQLVALNQQEDKINRTIHVLKTATGMLEKIDPVFKKEEE